MLLHDWCVLSINPGQISKFFCRNTAPKLKQTSDACRHQSLSLSGNNLLPATAKYFKFRFISLEHQSIFLHPSFYVFVHSWVAWSCFHIRGQFCSSAFLADFSLWSDFSIQKIGILVSHWFVFRDCTSGNLPMVKVTECNLITPPWNPSLLQNLCLGETLQMHYTFCHVAVLSPVMA